MTKIKKVREITIEVERIRVVSNFKKEKEVCEICQIVSDFIPVVSAVRIFQLEKEFIEKLAEENLVHFKLSLTNEALICLNSLISAIESFK